MHVQVLYQSRKNTKKAAEAIAQALGVSAQGIQQADFSQKTDLLFLGFGIYAGHPPRELTAFLSRLTPEQVSRVALFTTSASGNDQTGAVRGQLTAQGVPVAEKAFCGRGSFLFMNKDEPSAETLAAARAFALDAVRDAKNAAEKQAPGA
ncbi:MULTISPECIES: flavodoxin family protein [Caproicibacterium]|uniref:Flavodoxin family protein n=1 Tax=Caproicibacterium argilliputei TaxID=3030016 RepID=A0AA97DBD6_9FIRM|nr:flavodoxin family protein [Caproicibacterium argilliputei]WOC32669.1 flavodoxin family protein [Caproicibacterium argilliputei]